MDLKQISILLLELNNIHLAEIIDLLEDELLERKLIIHEKEGN